MKTNSTTPRTNGNGFRDALQSELASRCARNPRYSLRAFARDLNVDHSTLSQILRRKRSLTADAIRTLGTALQLDDAVVDAYIVYEERLPAADIEERRVAQLRAEAAEVIAQWHHYAILELTRLKSFQPDVRWIARVLDISTDEANVAVTRLLHLGLLEMPSCERWVAAPATFADLGDLPRRTLAQVASQMAHLAEHALLNSAADNRAMLSSTIAVRADRLQAAIEFLHQTHRDLAALLASESDHCDDVYQFHTFLFPLTNDALAKENPDGTTRDSVSDHRERPGQGG